MMKHFFQTQCRAFFLVFIVYSTTLLAGCGENKELSPEGYQLNKPKSFELGKVLNEISGISFQAEDSSLIAISDNQEKIIQIQLKNMKLKDMTKKVVAPESDLEGVAVVENTIYILLSRGVIKAVQPGAGDSSEVITYTLPLGGVNDFETLYYDRAQNALIMICKSCAHEKGEGFRTAFRFDLKSNQFDSIAHFRIQRDAIEEILKDKDIKFAPSAAAIHPITNQLFILSSAGNLLVITDRKGQVLEAYKLNPDIYPQAEGIAFAPNGDMFISNEGKLGKANLLVFPYLRTGKKNK
jgi:uncharacterized protein YjiK